MWDFFWCIKKRSDCVKWWIAVWKSSKCTRHISSVWNVCRELFSQAGKFVCLHRRGNSWWWWGLSSVIIFRKKRKRNVQDYKREKFSFIFPSTDFHCVTRNENQWGISWIFNELYSSRVEISLLFSPSCEVVRKDGEIEIANFSSFVQFFFFSLPSKEKFQLLCGNLQSLQMTFPLFFFSQLLCKPKYFCVYILLRPCSTRSQEKDSWLFFNLNYFHLSKHVTHFSGDVSVEFFDFLHILKCTFVCQELKKSIDVWCF